jgi:hypothetical protein
MTDTQDLSSYSGAADDFRAHYDQFYLGVIPRLLNQEAMFLAFLSMIAAVETLAGAYKPNGGTGERFREFVGRYFPKSYGDHLDALWKFRNRMVHAFNPHPFMLTCHSSRMHLCKADDTWMLNAEDFYSDVVSASRAYFGELYSNLDLQRNFVARITADDGGRPYTRQVASSIGAPTPAAQQTHAARRDA